MVQNTKKATSIELIRFVAAIVVMLYHFFTIYVAGNGLVPFAYIFVEFFFLLSGFFMMKHIAERTDSMNPAAYVLHKAASFYPIFIIAFALQFVLFVFMNQIGSPSGVAGSLFHFRWEALLLQTAGFIPNPQFNSDYLLGQAWYLSAMLLSLLIAYPLAKHLKKWYLTLVCPLVILFVYSYIMQTLGTMNIGNEYMGVVMSAVLRGLAGTCAGSLCYVGYARLKEHPFRRKKTAALVEIVCYAGLVGLFFIPDAANDADSLFFILVFALLIVFGFANQTPISRFLNAHGRKLLTCLGSLSLYLYLLHWPVMSALQLWAPDMEPAAAFALFFGATAVLSALLKWLNDKRKSALPVVIVVCALFAFAFFVPLLAG